MESVDGGETLVLLTLLSGASGDAPELIPVLDLADHFILIDSLLDKRLCDPFLTAISPTTWSYLPEGRVCVER